MRKFLLAAAGAMALVGGATAANAASTVTQPVPSVLVPPASALFGATITGGSQTFDNVYNFSIAGSNGQTDAQISTLFLNGTQDVDFSSVTLDGMNVFTMTSTAEPETWAILSPVYLTVGPHTIEVIGSLDGTNGSYSGTINVQQAVPEAKTWAMMLLGFGAMGVAMRRRRKPVLAQVA